MVIGYTQGTFDMFHIGHLNLLRNAKAQCDYLVVGVNSDELVKEYKKMATIVPVRERMEIVGAIRYVDKVIECDTLDKVNTQKKLKFNKLFIGDDWKGTARWMKTEEEMCALGIEVVYLPHTDGICSTILREKLPDNEKEN